MNKLSGIISGPDVIAEGMKQNGSRHVNYRMYTTMDRARALLETGYLYLSDGSSWNDVNDRNQMKEKRLYAVCLSSSTVENVAMWMLYSGDRGKNGAMLKFPGSVLRDLLVTESIEIGTSVDGIFNVSKVLNRAAGDYEVFLTDVLYTQPCSNGKVRLTVGDDHITCSADVQEHRDVFHKHFAWSYEKECRLAVRISTEHLPAYGDGCLLRLKISPAVLRALNAGNSMIRSPVYSGTSEDGIPSILTGQIDWEL